MNKENWDCKECGSFKWLILKPVTDKNWKKQPEFEENGLGLAEPKTKKEWEEAQLYNGESIFEMSEIEEYAPKDFCNSCQRKLKKAGIFRRFL